MFPAFLLLICFAVAIYLALESWPAKTNVRAGQIGRPARQLVVGLVLAAVVFIVVLMLLTGRFHLVIAAIALLMLWGRRILNAGMMWRQLKQMGGTPGAQGFSGTGGKGQKSEITTEYFQMTLDHDTGEITGHVRKGHVAGTPLDNLTEQQAQTLYRECAGDENSRRVFEAWLDRNHSGWRNWDNGAQSHGRTNTGQGNAASGTTAMSVEEACKVLEVPPGADEKTIRQAYHRLMAHMHPDQGGSNYFAAKLNEARDTLLKNKGL